MINTKITGSSENVQIAQAVAREYGIKPSIVKKVMEEAITAASQKKYGSKYKVRARMDMNNGQVTLERILTVVDEVEDADTEISLQAAKRQNPEVELGGEICSKLPAIDVERGAANIAKQIIQKGIKEALNEKVFHDFKDRIGDVLLTVVDSFERGNVIVDLGNKVKAIIPKSETIISEKLKKGDRVLTYISDVSLDNPNYIIALSRSHNHLVGELLKQEVPEIEENIIEIKSIAREPGSLAKVAVYTSETGLDPVGSCVG
ncbi:MAG: NusA N-terminal domain-containing protein, partial [Pseudomonadota bacterium]